MRNLLCCTRENIEHEQGDGDGEDGVAKFGEPPEVRMLFT